VLTTMPWLRKYRGGRNTLDTDETIYQMEEDLEEVINLCERDRKRLEIESLKSEKAMRTAVKSARIIIEV
jgi:hypothetical protein